MTLAYMLVTGTYMLIGGAFYLCFPLPKFCIEDVCRTIDVEPFKCFKIHFRICWTTSTNLMHWQWQPRCSSSSRWWQSSPWSCIFSEYLSFIPSTKLSGQVLISLERKHFILIFDKCFRADPHSCSKFQHHSSLCAICNLYAKYWNCSQVDRQLRNRQVN